MLSEAGCHVDAMWYECTFVELGLSEDSYFAQLSVNDSHTPTRRLNTTIRVCLYDSAARFALVVRRSPATYHEAFGRGCNVSRS